MGTAKTLETLQSQLADVDSQIAELVPEIYELESSTEASDKEKRRDSIMGRRRSTNIADFTAELALRQDGTLFNSLKPVVDVGLAHFVSDFVYTAWR